MRVAHNTRWCVVFDLCAVVWGIVWSIVNTVVCVPGWLRVGLVWRAVAGVSRGVCWAVGGWQYCLMPRFTHVYLLGI